MKERQAVATPASFFIKHKVLLDTSDPAALFKWRFMAAILAFKSTSRPLNVALASKALLEIMPLGSQQLHQDYHQTSLS